MIRPVVLSSLAHVGITCESHTLSLSQEIFLTKTMNPAKQPVEIRGELATDFVQIYVVNKGKSHFSFYKGTYQKKLQKSQSLLFFNPAKELDYHMNLAPQTTLLSIFIPVKLLHEWLRIETVELPFQQESHIQKKYYASKGLTPALRMVVGQLFNLTIKDSKDKLYALAKVMEMVSLYFSQDSGRKTSSCPFLRNEDNAQKIRQAEQILLERYKNPPLLEELAKEIGLNTCQLKTGFKKMFGNTVHRYVMDHRMDQARRILELGESRVNEVGYQVGYGSTSHFISAFKKKFGITPKKYLLGK